jgi:hypothetical protein
MEEKEKMAVQLFNAGLAQVKKIFKESISK